jgi:hypothetical protein
MAQYWNGYQWRELAEDRPGEPELRVDAPLSTASIAAEQKGPFVMTPNESLLARSMKPTRRELHVHTFVDDVCACGETED